MLTRNRAGARHRLDRSKRYRWLISYADMITLLMATFVMMLAVSSADTNKFAQQAEEMRRAFTFFPIPAPEPDEPPTRPAIQVIDKDTEAAVAMRLWRSGTVQQVQQALANEIAARDFTVVEADYEVIIRLPDNSGFLSGSAELSDRILPALDRLAGVLARVDGQIVVSGHTDNIPISNPLFRSNWALSAARSVAVVDYLIRNGGLSPARLTAQGFAESRPLAGNDTPEGRAQNRRVDISLTKPQ